MGSSQPATVNQGTNRQLRSARRSWAVRQPPLIRLHVLSALTVARSSASRNYEPRRLVKDLAALESAEAEEGRQLQPGGRRLKAPP